MKPILRRRKVKPGLSWSQRWKVFLFVVLVLLVWWKIMMIIIIINKQSWEHSNWVACGLSRVLSSVVPSPKLLCMWPCQTKAANNGRQPRDWGGGGLIYKQLLAAVRTKSNQSCINGVWQAQWAVLQQPPSSLSTAGGAGVVMAMELVSLVELWTRQRARSGVFRVRAFPNAQTF